MSILFTKKYLFFVILCLSLISYGQNTLTLKKGVVIDSLIIPSTGNHFSIYLPKSFNLNKSWPLLLGFDSSGNTGKTAHLYREAAEEHGYIVAISNFLEEQEAQKKVEYVSDFMSHVFSLFPIQKGRIYIAGVQEDAKLASLLAALYPNEVFGVIAIEDTYFYDSRIRIKKSFSYRGIVSIDNHKYQDFFNIKKYLKSRAVPADVYVYEKDSGLLLNKQIKKALSDFTLQAMNKGRMPKDSIWVKNLFQKEMKEVELYLDQGKFLNAFDEVKGIRLKYGTFFNTNDLKEKQKEIRKTKEYKQQKRLETKYLNKENFLREVYLLSMEEDIEVKEFENLGWWKYQMSELDTLILGKEKLARYMAYRMKGYVKYLVDSYKNQLLKEEENLEENLFLNILSTLVDKKDFESYRKVISLSAQDQDNETALFYLEQMLKNGYKDLNALYTIEGTLALKMSEKYNKLIKKYLGNSKYFFSK
ncbi:hypothetical protein IWQ47_003534 [Aquimarina sp. EL_43]|uniref:hypothetical protein n=1 Tax=unclassified Aquimarina TaxID=2627091 RepID=UPI0018CB700A|nr:MULTISPECIES: hypothetical protein [unclassified Aquimarina]MBG6132494.1 hypothetical protein [Aquimarina sp. EL_35]MBG6152625.1 hypothetical protein [Aquimarina sp. EL_32]MBG6170448.1 hypothetical protein [Aquimarina sp. EL_43]